MTRVLPIAGSAMTTTFFVGAAVPSYCFPIETSPLVRHARQVDLTSHGCLLLSPDHAFTYDHLPTSKLPLLLSFLPSKTVRARKGNKPRPEARASAGPAELRAGRVSESRPPEGHEDLKKLIHGYHGFGILSLIRALLFKGCRFGTLAIVGIALLIGQWMGPVGFIAFKVTTEDIKLCAG